MLKKQIRKQISQSTKLLGLLLLFLLPFGAVVYQLITEINIGINFAQKERLGLEYNTPLRKILEHIIKHRSLTNSYLNGDRTVKNQLENEQKEIEKYFIILEQIDRQIGTTLATTEKWMALDEKWQELLGKLPSFSPEENMEEHKLIIADIIALISHVGDTSNLILDPVLDSYYLMDAVITKLPSSIENTARSTEMVKNIAKRQQGITTDEKIQLIILSSLIESAIDSVHRGLKVSFNTNPNLKENIKKYAQEAFTSNHISLGYLNKKIINFKGGEINLKEYLEIETKSIDTQFQLYDVLLPNLDRLLEARITNFSRKKYFIQIFAIFVTATAIYVFLAFAKNLQKQEQAEAALQQAEAKYRSIFENATEGIFQTTPDGRYISANPALARIYGYSSPADIINQINNIWQQLYVNPNRRAEFVAAMERDNAVSEFESQVYRQDGSIIWISEKAHTVRDDHNRVLYYEGSVEDITARKLAEEAVRFQQEQTERLLLNILPGPIAERLKFQENTIADSFAEVTVLFADIVNFTEIASRTSPTELVKLLNKIFSLFDQLADRYHLEKIKTIGDAYMVVGGLPIPREDHAEAIAEMALDMQEAISKFQALDGEPFRLRIGINTGPVVAGVIGIKKFIYDLWGDTVNIASRMESHGIAGGIQVTDTTYKILQNKYLFEQRGVIHVKGKGDMLTYILYGKNNPDIN